MWIVIVCGDLERKGEATGRGFAAIPCSGLAPVGTQASVLVNLSRILSRSCTCKSCWKCVGRRLGCSSSKGAELAVRSATPAGGASHSPLVMIYEGTSKGNGYKHKRPARTFLTGYMLHNRLQVQTCSLEFLLSSYIGSLNALDLSQNTCQRLSTCRLPR
jgi:hypothetical protein